MYRLLALLASLLLVAAACSSGDESDTSTEAVEDEAATTAPPAEPDENGVEDTEETAEPEEEQVESEPAEEEAAPTETPTGPSQGVSDDTIKIGYTYINLDDLREAGVIDVNHGPLDQHIQALADDMNANGGIHGRMIELIVASYDPITAEAQQAACIELTEDEEVFAVLGAIGDDNVLCYTEQHETIAVTNGNMTDERQTRAVAPYTSASQSADRNVTTFIEEAAAAGLFDGKTVAVHSTEADKHALATDVAVPALEAAGVEVAFESLVDAGGASVGGAAAATALNAEAMRDKGVDAVFVVGDALVVSNAFIGESYFPTMFFEAMGSASAVSVDADLSVFDGVYTFGGLPASDRYQEETFQEQCVSVWEAAHPDDPVLDPNDVEEGEPNHTVGLGNACRVFTIFALAAEAAGPELNNATFLLGLESIGDFSLPGIGAASLSQDKYDSQDNMPMWVYAPARSTDELGFAPYDG